MGSGPSEPHLHFQAFVEGKSKTSDWSWPFPTVSSSSAPVLKCGFYYDASKSRPADQMTPGTLGTSLVSI